MAMEEKDREKKKRRIKVDESGGLEMRCSQSSASDCGDVRMRDASAGDDGTETLRGGGVQNEEGGCGSGKP